ncbi:unnamed protein product, partial [Symbiodinium sp. CCMP2592]
PKPAKLASCLQKVWSTLPADVCLQFEQAGFKVPAPKQEDVDLLSLLQRNRDDLPQEVLDALPAAPVPNPVQEGKAAGVEWRNSVGKLRDLGPRKLKLQEDIDLAKANLRALLTKMQDLQASIQEAQTEVNKATQDYEAKVLTQCAEEASHGVDSVLQALGIEEDTLTEAQKRSIAALKKDNADEAKRRKTEQQDRFPPGLLPKSTAPPAAEPQQNAADAKDLNSQSGKARSRSPKRGDKGWGSLLNLSAYKALEGLEEQSQEGTLEYWTLFRSLEATEARDNSLETWARIARASEDLVHSTSRGRARTFTFVSANVTSWRPELRQWLVSLQCDVALIQEHHLSEKAFHAESVALAKAGYHLHGQHSPARKREIGGVMVCVKAHLQARHVHTFQDPETGCGFVAIAVRVTGFDLALISLYLESGSSFEGRTNTVVLSHLYGVLASLKCPWCVVGDWNIDSCEVLATRLEDLTRGRLLGTGMPTAGTAAELDYALVHPTLADSFDPITDDQRLLTPTVVSPQQVVLLEIEASDPVSLAFAEFSATAEAITSGLGKNTRLPFLTNVISRSLSRELSMGPVYRALKSHEQTLARPFRDQSALARAYCRMEFWSHIWDATIVPPQVQFSAERLALRAEASQQAQDLSPLSWEQVKTACLATGNKKGGLDGWSYKALRNLPDFCYRQLAGLFRLAETDLTLPLQMLTVQVALLAKTPEKERPISLTSVLWRVYSKLRRPLLESWLKEYAAFAPFDSATPGHTSLDPALSRLIKAEDHKFRKVTFITLFVDLEGFYDGVDFSRLISQGKALSFPPLLLELSLQLYNGPRCLHGEGVSTVALWPQRGILQGCPYAPTVAKLTTHAPLQGISQHRGVSHADLWLDDISVDVSHADPEVAASLALSASRKLEALLSVEKLRINKTKTKFVVNSAKAAKALNSMRVEGDPQVADLVRDLGLDSAGAKRRRVTHALKRFKVGRARNQKLHQLGTGCKAHRLYATSILTAEIYGCQGQGLSPKRLKVVRASISRHVGRSKWGSVDVSLDCMSFRCQDPLLTVVLAQADALYKMFGPSTAQGWEILARTWKVAWTRQEAAVHGWKCVAGPVAAMVQYCIDLRINVSDPLRWVHSSGVLLLDVTNPGLFLSVRRFLTQVVALERASRFGAVLTAQGAQQGVDWSVHRKLLKVSKLSSPRWAFHAVWQGRTLHAGNGGFSHCACGAENTLHHVYYECRLAPAKLSPALRSFQRKHPDPCFWLRGMVPKAWTTPQVSASALETRVTGLFCHQPVDVTGLLIGTDASGGPNTHDPRLRAVGWSVVLCELRADGLIEHGTISGLLPPGSTATTGSFDLTGDCKPAFEAEFPGQLWRRELNAKADTLAGSRASRFYNLKDLGFFNFGVDARGFIMMWDTADWLPWEGQRAHWPNRQRASAFWSAVKRSVPDHFQELLQLVSNASPEEVLQRLRPLLTQHYKWCLLQQGVFLGD